MIGVDTNVLVYAHRRDSAFHLEAETRLRALAERPGAWAIPWPCVHEFLAIVTHPRIYDPPSSLEAAAGQVDAWLESPGVVLLSEGPEHWPGLRDTLVEARVMGPVVHDARIAAICAAHGIDELWSADRDFGRFSAVRAVNPLL